MILASSAVLLSSLLVAVNAASKNVPQSDEPVGMNETTEGSKCNNVYNAFYAGPNKEIEALLHELEEHFHGMEGQLYDIQGQLTDVQEQIAAMKGNTTEGKVHRKNCAELFKSGIKTSGVSMIQPDNSSPFQVYCDQTTAGGGWTVFQKRLDGSVEFYRGWDDYKRGFGNLNGEFWLGLDKIHRLTNSVRGKLRVDLEDIEGNTAYAEYDMFAVASEKAKYQLGLGTFSGTAGDSFGGHRGAAFSTKDRDNDVDSGNNCAALYKGGWWYTACHGANLNGLYHHGVHESYADGVNWYDWKGYKYSAKRAEMKFRPVDF